jgi:hypothetical protein
VFFDVVRASHFAHDDEKWSPKESSDLVSKGIDTQHLTQDALPLLARHVVNCFVKDGPAALEVPFGERNGRVGIKTLKARHVTVFRLAARKYNRNASQLYLNPRFGGDRCSVMSNNDRENVSPVVVFSAQSNMLRFGTKILLRVITTRKR